MGATNGVVGTVTANTEAAVLSTGRGQAASLAVLVNSATNPVDAGIITDGGVHGVHHDDFIVLECSVLVNPVRVQHSKIGANAASTLLRNTAKVANKLKLVDTLVLRLAVNNTLVVRALATASTNCNSVDNIALFGFVAELVSLVGTSGSADLSDSLVLTVLPCSDNDTDDIIQCKLHRNDRTNLTRSKKRRTSLCFLRHISSRYL